MKRNSGVTIIGGIIALGLFVLFLCGLLWVGGKLLDAGKSIQARHDGALTNEVDKLSVTHDGGERDPVVQALLSLPPQVLITDEQTELNDRQFFKWVASLRSWAILRKDDLNQDWTDTGNRFFGESNAVRLLLFDLCRYEAPFAPYGKDFVVRTSGFYKIIPEEDVPIKPPDK